MVLGKNPGLVGSIVGGVGQKGFMLANSRSDETEADEYCARLLGGGRLRSARLVTFFGKLRAQEGNSPRFLAILSDHPAPPIASITSTRSSRRKSLRGTNTGAAAFAPISGSSRHTTSQSPPPTGRRGQWDPPTGAPPNHFTPPPN